MATEKATDEEFARAWVQFDGRVSTVATAFGMSERRAYERRLRVEKNLGIVLPAGRDVTGRSKVSLPKRGHRHIVKTTGACTAVVFGDAHYWPTEDRSTAFLALLAIIEEFKPKLIFDNGDAFDGARASRHPPQGWQSLPDVADELAVCQERKGEIAAVARKANPEAELRHHIGNHDARFAARLAMAAPEFIRVKGFDLADHFPDWSFSWSSEWNRHTMIKHRWHGGIHATWQNALKSGRNMVTNHLHRLCVTPIGDYNDRRWGVDCGTLSEFGPEAEKFSYGEDNPFNWGEGLAVLNTDDKGRLLPPELCEVMDGKAYFRGQVVASKTTKRRKAA